MQQIFVAMPTLPLCDRNIWDLLIPNREKNAADICSIAHSTPIRSPYFRSTYLATRWYLTRSIVHYTKASG